MSPSSCSPRGECSEPEGGCGRRGSGRLPGLLRLELLCGTEARICLDRGLGIWLTLRTAWDRRATRMGMLNVRNETQSLTQLQGFAAFKGLPLVPLNPYNSPGR